jgi:two-component system chemotaxis sensor kinase CheA
VSDELFNREEFVSYFRDEAEELLQQIDGDLLKLEEFATSKESDPEIINSLFRALHTIKGSGGMLGFTGVQGLAHKLENLCDLLRKDQMPLSESCVDILFSGRDFLTDLVAIAVGGEDAAAPGGLAEYMNRLDQFVAVYEETAHVIEGRTGPEHTFDEAVGESKPAADVEAFEAEIERLLKEAEAGRTSAPAPTVEPAAETPELVATDPVAAPAAPVPAEIAAGAKEAKPEGKRASLHQTIRVDIERLDALLNLVGELVINRTRISDIANTLERLMGDKTSNGGGASNGIIAPLAKDLADSAALLARTTNEIQESIMKVRMVPIGQVFERFPRLVRDVAKARGKEVQLVI